MQRISGTGTLRRRLAAGLLAASIAALAAGAAAKEAPEVGDDPAVERHMMKLASELRCPKCQNVTIAESQSGISVDLRQEIRELIVKGMSDDEIKAYMVARYGDFVLYRPPVETKTIALWFGPAVILAAGLLALYLALKRRIARLEREKGTADLSEADARRAQELLDAEQGGLS